jgi:selenocysteine lyase/cysteine desulfurase
VHRLSLCAQLFRNRHLFGLLDASCNRLGALLNCAGSDLALVPNATTATNAVLRDVPLSSADAVLSYSTGYGAVTRTLAYTYDTHRAAGREAPLDAVVQLSLPMSEQEIVDATKAKIEEVRTQGKKVKLAIVDTISSMPSACMPWERLVALFREEGVLSFVRAKLCMCVTL